MKIKKAKIKDSKKLEEIFSVLYRPELIWTEEKIRNEISNNTKEYYFLLRQTEIVGAVGLQFKNKECKFGPIVILKKFRNKNLGSVLIKFSEKLARKKGCDKIWCYSLKSYGVESFYEKNNWHKDKLIKYFLDKQDCYVFSKSLK